MIDFKTAAEISLLTTFLGDEEIRKLSKNPKFQAHIANQKRLIASILKDSFELIGDGTSSTSEAPPLIIHEAVPNIQAPRTVEIPEAQVTAPASSTKEVAPAGKTVNASVLEDITQLVAEKTGYPTDMLDPDMDLEADLGIDTIKQMEIMGIVRERYNIKPDKNFNLRQASSLRAIETMIRSTAG